jgi:hypothetical protein
MIWRPFTFGYASRTWAIFRRTRGQAKRCMLPEVSTMKMTYSLSTGIPPTGDSGGRRYTCWAWSLFISAVSSCWAATRRPCRMSWISESCRLALC